MALVAAVILAAAGIGLGLYRDHNLHHDERMTRRALSAGYVERHAAVGGVTVNYAEGPSDGLALLLIHGQGMEWEDYSPVLPALAKRYHVFAVDCLGHGESAHDPSLYSCVAGGDVLISFARQVIGGPYAVSGHSSGGILAAYVAAHDSANVLACILEDPPFFSVTPDEVQRGAGAFVWYDGYLPAHEYCEQEGAQIAYPVWYVHKSYLYSLFGGFQAKLARATESWCAKHPGEHVVNAWIPRTWTHIMHYMDDYDPHFGDAFYDGSWMSGLDQEALLKAIECPVVYLKARTRYGKGGVLYAANTDEDALRVQAAIPDCRTVVVESGHDIHQEAPNDFTRAIDAACGPSSARDALS